jgi:hypothetical protein
LYLPELHHDKQLFGSLALNRDVTFQDSPGLSVRCARLLSMRSVLLRTGASSRFLWKGFGFAIVAHRCCAIVVLRIDLEEMIEYNQ